MMDGRTLSNILIKIVPDDHHVLADVSTEEEYNTLVTYSIPSKKPTWAQVQAGIAPQQWIVVRSDRNKKLANSDWTQLDDVPLSNTELQEWQTYRQALRDIPTQSDPFNVTWPTPPV
tara:strand:+ start:423 stop:773 length:351 start_codon:yes stop_codon:yes gene_type:complete